jgi:hypothetical protein
MVINVTPIGMAGGTEAEQLTFAPARRPMLVAE